MHLKRNEGFTLIELLASIVLISIILTTFMHVFSQAILFSNKNEEKLTVTTNAREVLSILQENDELINLLVDENILSSSLEIEEPIIDDPNTIKRLLDPDNIFTLTGEDITLNLDDGPNNMIKVKVAAKSTGTSTTSTTYGYISKPTTTEDTAQSPINEGEQPVENQAPVQNIVTFDLSNGFNNSPEIYLKQRSISNLDDVFTKGVNNSIQIENKKIESNNGDLLYKKINSGYEFTLKANIRVSPGDDGGFGILVDGSLINTINPTDVGYMITFDEAGVDLYKRNNGEKIGAPLKTKQLSTVQWTQLDIELKAETKTTGLRKYTIKLKHDKLEETIIFDDIDLSQIINFNPNNRYIGIELWSVDKEKDLQNMLTIYPTN